MNYTPRDVQTDIRAASALHLTSHWYLLQQLVEFDNGRLSCPILQTNGVSYEMLEISQIPKHWVLHSRLIDSSMRYDEMWVSPFQELEIPFARGTASHRGCWCSPPCQLWSELGVERMHVVTVAAACNKHYVMHEVTKIITHCLIPMYIL